MATENKIEFLYQSISDTQDIIKFLETKTAFATSITGLIIVTFCSTFETVLKHLNDLNFLFWLLFIIVGLLIIICIWIAVISIKSVSDPKTNIKIKDEDLSELEFFLSKNEYKKQKNAFPFYNSKHFKLTKSYDSYLKTLSESDDEELIRVLSFELLKVSFIRNLKNDRFKVLIWLLLTTSVVFCIYYIDYLLIINSLRCIC
jgi:hypothetical protein